MRRPWALPLLPLYWLGQRVERAFAARRRPGRLGWPVVSIGSLSAGGAGKTPVVMALADLLVRHGVEVDVLTRGYGRGSGVVEEVDPGGPATRFGDEPLEMARAGLRVFVGADRFAAGSLAEASVQVQPVSQDRDMGHPDPALGARVHLLDDGFQHRRLWRTLDVVLLTLEDAQDWLLPAGNLREPLSSLRRADVVVLREDEGGRLREQVSARTGAEVWVVRRALELPPASPRRLLAFCGIARPEGFFSMLRRNGCEMAGQVVFPDHHAYRPEDLRRLAAAALERGAAGFVTTAKDAVKLSAADRSLLELVGPLAVARLRVTFADEDRVWKQLRQRLGTREASSRDAAS